MLAIDTETTGLFIHKGCRAFTITAVCDENKSYLWKFKVDPFTRGVKYKKSLLNDFFHTVEKHDQLIFHNANFDLQVLHALGMDIENIFQNHTVDDTQVMSHALYSKGPHGLKELGVMLLEFPADDEKRLGDITRQAITKAEKLKWYTSSNDPIHPSLLGIKKELYKSDYWIPAQIAEELDYPANHEWRTICDEYAIKDVIRTMGIYRVMQEQMTTKQKMSYYKARRLILPILRMQWERIPLIPAQVESTLKAYHSKKTLGTIRLQKLSGKRDFNPKSPDQLSAILYDKFKFPAKVFSDKTGNPATNKDAIAKMLDTCPRDMPIEELPQKYQFLLALKKWKKTDTTLQYAINYKTHSTDLDWHIQPFYKQTATGTNRLSCENPNATNVGKQDMSNPFAADSHFSVDEESFKLRNLFGPLKGTRWVCMDYDQFQLLIFAVVSNSKQLIESFQQGRDIHHTVASIVFKKDNISDIERTAAKAINFGILFGAGPDKIEKMAGLPGLYNLFLSAFPNARKFLAECESQAKRKGYVHTVGGYRLYVPYDRSYAASCYVIQGTEAEIVRDAMVDISNYLYSNPSSIYRMIMMVHDELVFRTSSIIHPDLTKVHSFMEKAGHKLGIPSTVGIDIVTDTWSVKKEYIRPCKCGDAIIKSSKTTESCLSCPYTKTLL